ncbi:MAG: hypothetical protein RLZZ628_2938 [Bacteroidota bacterium]|jgi:hypothetical protein
MRLDENKDNAIRCYLTQQMSATEVTDFEALMKSSPELTNEVQQWREFRVVVKHSNLLGQVALLKEWSKDVDGSEPLNEYDKLFQDTPISFWKTWKGYMTGGLSTICLVSLTYFGGHWFAQKKYSTQIVETSKTYSKPLVNFVHFEAGSDSTLKKLLIPYESGDYAMAIQIFENNPVIKADKTGQLFAGISYLLNGDASKAAMVLTPLANASFFHEDKALFYLVLAQLRLGKTQEARSKLLRMPANAFFKTESDAILKQIN